MMKAIAWTCLWFSGHVKKAQCDMWGHTPDKQSGSNNYAIDLLGPLLFPFGIDVCTQASLSSPMFYKYTCAGSNGAYTLTKTSYSDSTCTTSTATDTWQAGAPAGTYGYFKCDGQNTYVKVAITTDSTCATAATIAAGLGGCVFSTDMQTQTEVYCDADGAMAQIYLSYAPNAGGGGGGGDNHGQWLMGNETSTYMPTDAMTTQSYGMCDSSLYCTAWVFGTTCAHVTDLTVPGLGVLNIYGKQIECEPGSSGTTGSEGTTESTDSSLRVQFSLLNIILVLIAPLFGLF
jgi:hypothetical protein